MYYKIKLEIKICEKTVFTNSCLSKYNANSVFFAKSGQI